MFTQLQYELGAAKKKTVKKAVKQPLKASASGSVDLATARIIHIVGKADAYWGTLGATKSQVESATQETFANRGWDIKSVQFEWQPNLKTWWFRIIVNVDGQYSNEEIKASAITALKNVTGGFNTTVLSNINVDLEIPSTKPLKEAPTYKQSMPENSSSSSNSGGTSSKESKGILADMAESFGSGLGGGLGVSTPVVLLGAGIVLLIALKK